MGIISTAIAPYRLYAELAGAAALAITVTALYVGHNHKEQAIGAQKCIAATTETKQEATSHVQATEDQHAQLLAGVVSSYEQKLAALSADNDGMAQRLRDADKIRTSTVPAVAAASGQVCTAAVDAAIGQLETDHAASFAACLANQDEITAIRDAWNDLAKGHAPPR